MKTNAIIEPLEARIAPAVLIGAGGRIATFTDVDGDIATIVISKGALTAANFTTKNSGIGEQLQLIDLSAGGFDGANLCVISTKSATGDGRVNVGYINSTNHDLGVVKIKGDLSRIKAGDASDTQPGLKRLAVDSFGQLGIDTQLAGGSTVSQVEGGLRTLAVKGDFAEALLVLPNGELGIVKIGGSLIGGNTDSSGGIVASSIGTLQIGQDLRGGDGPFSGRITTGGVDLVRIGGSVIGGGGDKSGQFAMSGSLGPVTIGHSLIGGAGSGSGSIVMDSGKIGRVKIGHNMVGGDGVDSGSIECGSGDLAGLGVGGSMLGGTAESSGRVFVSGNLGPTKIRHDVHGGAGFGSAQFKVNGDIASLAIGGSLIGGSGVSSASIEAANIDHLIVGDAVIGGSDSSTGSIFATKIGTLRIVHDLQGGTNTNAGFIFGGTIGTVMIGGSIVGGSATTAGEITSGAGGIALLSVGGSVLGGSGIGSGFIASSGELGVLKIGGDLRGGSESSSGGVNTAKIGTALIGGSIIGGSNNSTGSIQVGPGGLGTIRVGGSVIGGTAIFTGLIESSADLSSVTIAGDLVGGSISGADPSLTLSGGIRSLTGRIGAVHIGGSIISGVDTSTNGSLVENAVIRSQNDIGSLLVRGSLVGNSNLDGASPVVIAARGQKVQGATTDLAIGKTNIGGSVTFSKILAGYTYGFGPENADAQIGPVKVGGTWAASSLVAGVYDVGNDGFGNFFDDAIPGGSPTIFSRIASITIGRSAIGTPESLAPSDHYGFVAQQIGFLKVAGRVFNLTSDSDNFLVGSTNDLRIREVL